MKVIRGESQILCPCLMSCLERSVWGWGGGGGGSSRINQEGRIQGSRIPVSDQRLQEGGFLIRLVSDPTPLSVVRLFVLNTSPPLGHLTIVNVLIKPQSDVLLYWTTVNVLIKPQSDFLLYWTTFNALSHNLMSSVLYWTTINVLSHNLIAFCIGQPLMC